MAIMKIRKEGAGKNEDPVSKGEEIGSRRRSGLVSSSETSKILPSI